MGDLVKVIEYPSRTEWGILTRRAVSDTSALAETVRNILADVAVNGDNALLAYAKKFDGAVIEDLMVTDEEFSECESLVDKFLKDAIVSAAGNIRKFHSAQKPATVHVETAEGVICEQKALPVSKVGLYIPGGNSPLFSTVLMLAIPANIAGCREIVLCSPPNKNGKIHPAILFAAKYAGVTKVFKAGGAQAIGAMAYGTVTIPKVYKIFGPGNRFVMEAKQQVGMQSVAIDMPAGPSEVMVIADKNANLEFVASDFLSQAEHGIDSQSLLLTADKCVVEKFPRIMESLLESLPRREMMSRSLSHSSVILLKDDDEIAAFMNEYAPEHLIINRTDARQFCDRVENAGSVFIGPYSPESAGDYASGTNHTLPTSGYAKNYSGVNLDSFMKKITFQELSPEGLANIGRTIEVLAENEDLMAHKLAVSIRLKEINKNI